VKASLAIVAFAALLGGCSWLGGGGESFDAAKGQLDAVTPPSWMAVAERARAGTVPTTWWEELDDPTLDVLVGEAFAHNHDLAAAASRVAAAEAEARIAGADLYPSLGAAASAARERNVYTGIPIPSDPAGPSDEPLSSTSNRFGVSLDVSWEIDLWGRLRSTAAAAKAELAAARIDYAGVRLSLAAQTAKAYFAVVEAREQLALAEETLTSYRVTAEQVQARYERGTRSPLDLRLALTQVAAAESRVTARRSAFERTRRQLEVLLGRYPGAELAAAGSLDHRTPSVPAGLPAELLGRRPDLAAAERRLYAADKRVRAARAALLPRVGLTGSAGQVSEEIADLLDGSFGVWSLAANLTQPIFQGGRLRAGVDLAAARAAGAQAEYAALALRAFAEVETALADEALLASLVASLAEAAKQSTAAESLADQRYLGGLESYVTVLAAKRSSLDARSALIDAKRQRLETRIDLYLALGGGFPQTDAS
jgi:NodT family efflux transporter outer membrane factor (OMF) lipoprotein